MYCLPAAPDPRNAPNSQGDLYRAIDDFLKLPPGRSMGSTSSVAVDSQGNVWVFDRCGANSCAGSDLDPIMEFDSNGRFVKAFGHGRFIFPHGIYIDARDHIWVVDEQARDGKGVDVLEFDKNGKLLRTLGHPACRARDRTPSVSPTPSWWHPTATFSSPTVTTPVLDIPPV